MKSKPLYHRLLAGLLLLIPLLGYTQGSALDTRTAPKIQLIDDHYRHEIGTGFLLEVDVSRWMTRGETLHLQPVRQVDPGFEQASTRMRLPKHARNPLLGLFAGVARIGDFGRRPVPLPLPYQPIYPLDSGTTLDTAGVLWVQTPPANGRLRLFIPQYFARDSAAIYLIVHEEGLLSTGFKYVQSPKLVIDRALPDINIQLLTSQRGRYHGVEGQWIRFSYQPPPYLALAKVQDVFMQPRILLNGKYVVPNPNPDFPAAWGIVNAAPGEFQCFVPDAATGSDGKLTLTLDLELNAATRLTTVQGISLDGPQRPPCGGMRVQITSIAQSARPRRLHPDPGRFSLSYTAGGTRMGGPGASNLERSSAELLVWDEAAPVLLPVCAKDSIGILLSGGDGDEFEGRRYAYFLLPVEKLQGACGSYVVKQRYKRLRSRFMWKFNIAYWRE